MPKNDKKTSFFSFSKKRLFSSFFPIFLVPKKKIFWVSNKNKSKETTRKSKNKRKTINKNEQKTFITYKLLTFIVSRSFPLDFKKSKKMSFPWGNDMGKHFFAEIFKIL